MVRTRSDNEADAVHVLNFYTDDATGCALTVLVKDFRFHITIFPSNLSSDTQDEREHAIKSRYHTLLEAVKVQERQEGQDGGDGDECKPDAPSKHRGSARGSSHGSTSSPPDTDDDSAIEITRSEESPSVQSKKSATSNTRLDVEEMKDPEKALSNWMLRPFADIFDKLAPASDEAEDQTLEEWYSGPTYFYTLDLRGTELQAIEQQSSPELEEMITKITPRINIPKYIRELDIPWYQSSEATVLSASDDPDPYHPSRVRIGDETYFLKVVASTQPQPTKRELRIMKEIERKGLHNKIRVPLVKGLVGYRDSKTQILGFLQTEIEDPTPLTLMLDSDVVEDKREKWAKETERMVKVLHDNDIVWGDAKADNFMVDRNGELWIIDFGGSFTDGWVDPEIMETEEGDNQGVGKIVRALEDPEANTYDPGEEIEGDSVRNSSGKRKQNDQCDIKVQIDSSKRRRLS
ncbi:hypothetical protein F5Y15DRAFT_423758 [Xylariaceae sp. FL0016]|nr:hypothetical protein F5Y15DRAFT_423758 [Xylariaceae sp. FL0016]